MKLPIFEQGSVVILGDVMLDRYLGGDTSRISPEAPVPVVKIANEQSKPGGAANVALGSAALGSHTTLIGLIGDDSNGKLLQEKLAEKTITAQLCTSTNCQTISKLRVLSRHQQLLRLDFESPYEEEDAKKCLEPFMSAINKNCVVILSDYGKGTLFSPAHYIQAAKLAGCKVIIDPKNPDLSVYKGAHLLTPNFKEFTEAVGPCADDDEVVSKGEQLRKKLALDALLVTRGEQGMTLLAKGEEPLHLPTHAQEVYDVTGAGDTVIATIASSLAAGESLADAVALSNVAAGITVSKLGAATVSPSELSTALMHHEHHAIITDRDHLLQLVDAAKDKEQKVVFTNGCFDILHSGHVEYLQAARKLGDYLIVAVNSDESVRGLKGDSRPYNNLNARMQVLAALECVDWVIPFHEETPESLIQKLSPHYLVKGGDYPDKSLIAGSEHVSKHGGEVKIIPFKQGFSTTKLIQKILSVGEPV